MAKPYVVRYPDCRCNGYSYMFGWAWRFDHWHHSSERGEYVPVPVCKKGLGCTRWACYPYTPLRSCDNCGRVGNAKQIKARNDCFDLQYNTACCTMCMACWNRLRPVIHGLKKLRECQSLVNKIRRLARERARAQ